MKLKSILKLMTALFLASILIPASSIQPVEADPLIPAVDDDELTDFSYTRSRKLKILVFALHHPYFSGYIGGAWERLLEFLKRAKTFNINYVLIEPSPKFKEIWKVDYESIQMFSHKYSGILGSALVILEATIKGIRRAMKRDIDLIISPIETPHCTISAFVTSLITGIPWTLIAHDVPVYAGLIEKQPIPENCSSSFKDLYQSIKLHKHKGKRIYYIISSTVLNYILYKVLRTTVVIGIGSTVKYFDAIDDRIRVREVFPANSIPLSAIEDVKKKTPHEFREYDALFVGSLVPEKGILDAVQAWALVTKKNPSLRLYIIGKAKELKMVKLIETMIDQNNLKDNVSFLCNPLKGAPPDTVWKTMDKSKILIFPSIMDTWSITVGEALALGLPVVAYDIFALKRAYSDCKAIVRIPIGDVDQLTARVIKLLQNPLELAMLSKEATSYVKNYYTWNDVISAERSLYEELCKK